MEFSQLPAVVQIAVIGVAALFFIITGTSFFQKN